MQIIQINYYRFRVNSKMDGKVLLYLSSNVAQVMSMYFWQYTLSKGIMVQCLLLNLYGIITSEKISIFQKAATSSITDCLEVVRNRKVMSNTINQFYYIIFLHQHFILKFFSSYSRSKKITKMNVLYAISNATTTVKAKGHIKKAFRILKLLNVKKPCQNDQVIMFKCTWLQNIHYLLYHKNYFLKKFNLFLFFSPGLQ